jgi:hypothetical protein
MDEHTKLRKLLNKYLYEAKYKSVAHGRAEGRHRKLDKLTSWTQSILSLVVGITSLSTWNNVDDCGDSTNLALIITSIVLSFTAAGIGATRGTWKFAGKESAHHQTAGNYADMVTDIELFLTNDLSDLSMLKHFVDVTHERLDIHDASATAVADHYITAAKAVVPYPKNGLFNPLAHGLGNTSDSDELKMRLEYVSRYEKDSAKENVQVEIRALEVKERDSSGGGFANETKGA